MNKNIILGFLLFILGQAIIWYQTNSQFFSEWAKNNSLLLSLLGIPVSYTFIHASKHVVKGFDGLLWPGRFVGFSTGMIVMALFTYIHLGEGVSTKTFVTLFLAFCILIIQLMWK